jgi:hypothetical protein
VAFLFSGQAYSVTAPRVTARHGHGHGTAVFRQQANQACFIFTVGKFYMNEAAFSGTKI